MTSFFEGKVALITGGGTGIGRATALEYVNAGGRVFVVGRRKEPLKSLASSHPDQVGWRSADLAVLGEAQQVVSSAIERFGRLDLLVNNAGAYVQNALKDTADAEIRRIFELNVFATMALIREATPALTEAGGSIVSVSSTLTRGVMPGTSVYSASKAALEQLTRVLAAELGPAGIRVNAVAPGVTETDINSDARANADFVQMMVGRTPLGRLGKPEDIARVIVQLTDAPAAWVTGQVIQAGGGLML